MSVIKLENVSKYYKSAETVSVGMQKVNLEFNMGEFVAVTGESGSGKSTLLNVLSGLDSYEEGEFYLFGDETSHYVISDWEKYRSAYVGFVFQSYNIIDSYSVLQNVLLALEIQGYDPLKKKERAIELIDQVGLSSHMHHKASKLSGGQKQRAVIARALAKDCPIIVADEPTGNLDSKSAKQVMKLLHDISKNKLVIVVTHDYDVVEEYATRKIRMHDGEVIEDKQVHSYEPVINPDQPVTKKMNFGGILRFAFRNLVSTPKRTIFITMMQMIVMLSFTLLYASMQSAMLSEGTYNNSENLNVTETRMLVEKRDGTDLTQADYDYLSSINEVNHVYEKGRNFYNNIRLYAFNLDQLKTPNYYYGDYSPGLPSEFEEYISNFNVSGTDAASSLSTREFSGSMPVAANEIIIDDPFEEFSIGDRIALVSSNYVSGATELDDRTYETFVVTGITHRTHGSNYNSGYIFFSDEFLAGDAISDTYIDTVLQSRIKYDMDYNTMLIFDDKYFDYYPDYYVVDNVLTTPSASLFNDNDGFTQFDENSNTITGDLTFITNISMWNEDIYMEIEREFTLQNIVLYEEYDTYFNEIFINQATYDLLVAEQEAAFEYLYTHKVRDNASITFDSQSAGNRILNRIDSDIYRVYYPANVPNPQSFDIMLQTAFYNFLLFVFGIFLYLIVHAVTRNTMRSRSKDFAIYRSIGAQKTVIARLVVVEQMMIAFTSIILTLVAITIMSYYIFTINSNLSVLTPRNYIYLFALFMFFGAWLGLRFNKKVFKQSVIENINLSKEVN